MKKYLIVMLALLMVFIVGCDKNDDTKTTETSQGASNDIAVDTTEGPVVSDGEWESYFEDPIFAQALRNGLEEQILTIPNANIPSQPQKLEDYGLENVFNAKMISLTLSQVNPISGEDLGEDYRSKITSVKGIEKFISAYNIDFHDLSSISEEDMNASLKLINSNSSLAGVIAEIINLSNTNVSDLSFIKYPEWLKEVYVSNTKVSDGTLESLVGLKLRFLDISESQISKIPNIDYSTMQSFYMKNLATFDSSSFSSVDLQRLTYLNIQGTPVNLADLPVMSGLTMLQAGSAVTNVANLYEVNKDRFPMIGYLVLKLDDYTGFGNYLKSGTYHASEIVLVNPLINDNFLKDLVGNEQGDAIGYRIRLLTPEYDSSISENDTGNYIEMFSNFVTMYIDEIITPVPKEVETYFSGTVVVDGIFDAEQYNGYLVERKEFNN